jgi:hypothetical protein
MANVKPPSWILEELIILKMVLFNTRYMIRPQQYMIHDSTPLGINLHNTWCMIEFDWRNSYIDYKAKCLVILVFYYEPKHKDVSLTIWSLIVLLSRSTVRIFCDTYQKRAIHEYEHKHCHPKNGRFLPKLMKSKPLTKSTPMVLI